MVQSAAGEEGCGLGFEFIEGSFNIMWGVTGFPVFVADIEFRVVALFFFVFHGVMGAEVAAKAFKIDWVGSFSFKREAEAQAES